MQRCRAQCDLDHGWWLGLGRGGLPGCTSIEPFLFLEWFQWIPLHLHFLADLRLANWFPFPSWIPSNKLSPAGHWSLVVLPEPPRTLSGRVGPWSDRHTQLGSLRSGGPRLSTGREDDAVGRWSFSGNHGIWRDTMRYDTMEYNGNNNDNNYSNNNDNNNNDNTHNSNIYYI